MSLSSQTNRQQEEAALAAKFRRAAALCKDELDPDTVFGARWEREDFVHQLLEEVPDPVTHPKQSITLEKLGILYTKACRLRDQIGDNIKLRASLENVFSRIQHYLSSLAPEIDIVKEKQVFAAYFNEVLKQEVERFLLLAHLEPALTKPETYAPYQHPSQYPFKGDDLKQILKTYNFLFHFFLMDFGDPKEHPNFKKVAKSLQQEFEWHVAKVRLALIRKLQLSITKPYTLEELQKKAEAKADQDATVLPMMEFIKDPLPITIGDRVVEELKNHLQTADTVLSAKAEENPDMFHHLQMEMLPELIQQAEKLVFHVDPAVVVGMNGEDQFRKDHDTPETLPLYVAGLKTLRGAGEDLDERLLTATEGNAALARQVRLYATQALFTASLAKNREVRRTFMGFHGERQVEARLDDSSLFLTIDQNAGTAHLTGYGRVLLLDNANHTGEPFEVARLTLKIDVPFSDKGPDDIAVSFCSSSYSACTTEHRKNSLWNLI